MTIQTITQKDFTEMPWKNGGGTTIEIFRINNPKSSSFFFRLSMASVKDNGPFSVFFGIDRAILLLHGRGFHLESEKSTIVLEKNYFPIYFKGEEQFQCNLIDGPFTDFNIMTDRHYAKSKISIENSPATLKAESSYKFVYDNEAQELYKLEEGDELVILEKNKILIIIDLTIL